MARIRSVHPGITTDEAYMSMSFEAKAGWVLLWTECDDNGVFEWKPVKLKASIFPGDNVDFAALLDQWLKLNCIRKFEVEGKAYGMVRNFRKWQRPQKPTYRYPLPDEYQDFVGPRHVKSRNNTVPLSDLADSGTVVSIPMKEEGGRRDEERKDVVGEVEVEGDRPDLTFSSEVVALALRTADLIGLDQASIINAIYVQCQKWLDQAPAHLILIAIERVTIQRRNRGQVGPPRSMTYYDEAIRNVVVEFSRPLPVVSPRS